MGHTFSSDGMAVSGARSRQVWTWPPPTNRNKIRSFLGLLSYWKFCKERKPTVWNGRRAEHLENWMDLVVPTFEPGAPPFESDTGGSAALLRMDGEGRKHIITYRSTRLNKRMRQKSATQRELFVIDTMVRHFRYYRKARKIINRNGLPGADLVENHEGDSQLGGLLVAESCNINRKTHRSATWFWYKGGFIDFLSKPQRNWWPRRAGRLDKYGMND